MPFFKFGNPKKKPTKSKGIMPHLKLSITYVIGINKSKNKQKS